MPTSTAKLIFINEYGDAIPNLAFTLDDGLGPVAAVTDAAGRAEVSFDNPASLDLDAGSAIDALGDLLAREWPSETTENEAITTPFTDMPIVVDPGTEMVVTVMSRLQLGFRLAVPPSGDVRIDGDGLSLSLDPDGAVTIDLQANGGFPSTAFIDPPPPPIGGPLLMPDLIGWVPPDGYVVRIGDTAEALGELFLGDPARFAELSDHDPIPGETLTLPAEAVPGWLSLALDPLPPAPESVAWFTVVPDDLLRIFYTEADPAPLLELAAAIDVPPWPGEDPIAAFAARATAVAMILASPEVLGPERQVTE